MTLIRHQTIGVEIEHPTPGIGNHKESRDFDRGPPTKDITRGLWKIKLPKFSRAHAIERAEA